MSAKTPPSRPEPILREVGDRRLLVRECDGVEGVIVPLTGSGYSIHATVSACIRVEVSAPTATEARALELGEICQAFAWLIADVVVNGKSLEHLASALRDLRPAEDQSLITPRSK